MNTSSTQLEQSARRILVADPFKLFADACKTLVEPEFEVVAIVTDGAEIPEVVTRVAPGVILADAEMPRIDSLKSLGKSWGEEPAPKIVMLTTRSGTETCVEQFRLGASAIVSKQSDAHELVTALRSVVAGEYYISPNITRAAVESVVREATSSKRRRLTDRQQQIFRLLT
jgi:DNA-binding NarL/FixJ family response regulator